MSQVKFPTKCYFGLIIDTEEKTVTYHVNGSSILGYSNIPDDVHFFACFALGVTLTITKHIMGKRNIQAYLKKNPHSNKIYEPSDWVKEKLKN